MKKLTIAALLLMSLASMAQTPTDNLVIVSCTEYDIGLLKTAYWNANQLGWLPDNSSGELQYFNTMWRNIKGNKEMRLLVSVSGNKLYIRGELYGHGYNAVASSSMQLTERCTCNDKQWSYIDELAKMTGGQLSYKTEK